MPRFQGETFYENLKLVDRLDELAKEKGMKTTQLALAWVNSLSPYVSRAKPPSQHMTVYPGVTTLMTGGYGRTSRFLARRVRKG